MKIQTNHQVFFFQIICQCLEHCSLSILSGTVYGKILSGFQAGAFHSAELWYMFGTYKRCWRPFTEEDARLSEKMLDAWTGFMKNGAPGEEWKPYTEEKPYVQVFDPAKATTNACSFSKFA